MNEFDPTAYGPAFAALLTTDRNRPLGAGAPERDAEGKLKQLSVPSAFGQVKVVDRDMATCSIAGVWLLYDFLDESHTISQGIDTPSGSFWHGIMHRREGDFSNAKYWFRRVGEHAVFGALGERAAALAAEQHGTAAADALASGDWDPFKFVDLCQSAVRGQRAAEPPCRAVQQAEWELLFDHCYRSAIGE
jgi:hypothetical protein